MGLFIAAAAIASVGGVGRSRFAGNTEAERKWVRSLFEEAGVNMYT